MGDGAVWNGRIADNHDWLGSRLALWIDAEKRTVSFRGCRTDRFPHCASARAVVKGLVPALAEVERDGRGLAVWRVCCRFLVSFIEFAPPEARVIAANSSSMAMRGRNLFCVLSENEIARQSGGPWVDPRACSNSVEFIEKLLAQYKPDEKAVWIRKEPRQWSVAVNVPESATNFPVFVSANLDPSQFPHAWDGVTDADRKLELAQLPGADELRIGKKAVVIVRKGGAPSVCKAKYCNLKHVFNGPYELGEDAYFLTPAGKVWPPPTTPSAASRARALSSSAAVTPATTVWEPLSDLAQAM